ncbi:general odorant-binding protein 83a [Ochlerotatus camptorhynchus]|uniref:general odorant-binding protein 83a n=1 Tax=Ochlerotatus camptorhynchus TaxID=644619 RepID=UPI0031D86D4F
MKLILAVLLGAILVVDHSMAGKIKDELEIPEAYKRPAKILHNICLAESGAMESKLKQCMDGTLHDDREIKCYIYCLFDKIDVIDEATGRILLDRLAPLALTTDIKETLEHLTNECGHIKLEDSCDTAYEVAKCYFDAHDQVVKFCHLLMADVTS